MSLASCSTGGHAGVVLTPRGQRFLPVARQLLEAAENALATARAEPPRPWRVDVWGHLQPVGALVRGFADRHPGAVVEISMRRNLPQALNALRRCELDIAFGNVAGLDGPRPADLSRELVTYEPIAALVNRRSARAAVDAITPEHLRRHGLWWPVQASSPELARVVSEYAEAVGAP
jgi:DNA-binding transcriptional LysR family regulator